MNGFTLSGLNLRSFLSVGMFRGAQKVVKLFLCHSYLLFNDHSNFEIVISITITVVITIIIIVSLSIIIFIIIIITLVNLLLSPPPPPPPLSLSSSWSYFVCKDPWFNFSISQCSKATRKFSFLGLCRKTNVF